MKIQSISLIGKSPYSGSHTGQSSLLERQILELQKQVANIKESKQDAKTKAEKVKELEAQIDELQNQLNQQSLKERQKELEEAQQKMAEKLEQEAREQTKDPEGALFSLQSKNLLKVTQQYGEVETLRGVQSRLPTQAEREAFAPKIVAKAYEVQKELAKAADQQNKLSREVQNRTQDNSDIKESDKGATDDPAAAEGIAGGELTIPSPDIPEPRLSEQEGEGENRHSLPNRHASINVKV